MDINKNLLDSFKKIYEKQEKLSTLTDENLFEEFTNSEVHVIDIIGNQNRVNGVILASKLDMTRGAISKIIAKLDNKNVISKYKLPGNKKEIYYNLTDYGNEIYEKHRLAHEDWENREIIFFKDMDTQEKEIINNFLIKYNNYLNKLIEERS